MATYNSISDEHPATFESFDLQPCSGSPVHVPGGVIGSIPSSYVRTYNPRTTFETVSDPLHTMNRSFSRIKRSGRIEMTPFSHYSKVVENYVVSRHRQFVHWGCWYLSQGSTCCDVRGPEMFVRSWTENDHIGSLSPLTYPHFSDIDTSNLESLIQSAIDSTQSSAFASSLNQYDLLTEIGEARETTSFLLSKVNASADPFRNFKDKDPLSFSRGRGRNARSLLRSSDKALRSLGNRWMELRYAIMPLIYSIKDVNKLMSERNLQFRTSRDRSVIPISFGVPNGLPDRCTFSTMTGEVTVRSTSKVSFNEGSLRRVLAMTAFNPFLTAWELLPYSFVIDWFINVGDVITSQTSLDLSSDRANCTSIKRTISKSTFLHDFSSDVQNSSYNSVCVPNFSKSEVWARSDNLLLSLEKEESYRRFTWGKPQPRLSFDPFLNWKRFLDGAVLSYRPFRKILRSL